MLTTCRRMLLKWCQPGSFQKTGNRACGESQVSGCQIPVSPVRNAHQIFPRESGVDVRVVAHVIVIAERDEIVPDGGQI